MRKQNLDQGWLFDHGAKSPFQFMPSKTQRCVNLPHDYMIASDPYPEAPAGPASGFYNAQTAHYTKSLSIPAEWKEDLVFLYFDGIMMNASVEVNGSKAALQHYGYAPFCVELTPYLYFGEENELAVTVNPSMQPNSRWYSGAGIFRSVELVHTPKVYIPKDGIYLYTKEVEYDADGKPVWALLEAQIDVKNRLDRNILADVSLSLIPEGETEPVLTRQARIQVKGGQAETCCMAVQMENPVLWDAEHPYLYLAEASVTPAAEFRTHITPLEEAFRRKDEESALFGVRTISVHVRHGLRINGSTVKLKGGCVHHDNGLLGAVSLYDSELRRVRLMKEIGYNAVRTTHNPPSAALIEACDRLGMYVFDEAFDAWGMGKQPGDYNQFFETDWEKDLAMFIRRDRIHPSVILWSTGNEITERGGLGDGYSLATRLADAVKALDSSRPVTNAICSFWNGLDTAMMAELHKSFEKAASGGIQNADLGEAGMLWEDYTECFTNGLDLVGYNYLEDKYEQDHRRYPDRVILGSENFGNKIGIHWPMIENTPYVIGDFTWTAVDYIGEAGIGKAVYLEEGDPMLSNPMMAISSHTSEFPWRLANDADIDICGNTLPQGRYRKVVWGSSETFVFSYDPAVFGKTELLSSWGFTGVFERWNWEGAEGKNVRIAVFSGADEVELFLNGKSMGRCKAGENLAAGLPKSFAFDVVYEPGTVEAVSYKNGLEISRGMLKTSGRPAGICLKAEKAWMKADGHSLIYVPIEILDENGILVPDAKIRLHAKTQGTAAVLAGFGTGNPVTDENYTAGTFTTYMGRAMAILRSSYEEGETTLTVSAEGLETVSVTISVSK